MTNLHVMLPVLMRHFQIQDMLEKGSLLLSILWI